ncbi:MAG: hypothetical protein COB78_05735 [Hyphomicrobiales bacterium]|nr:MAG: hypothetical protein COB78_05735 [Hyphomicrobiales bacterium]
MVAVNDIESPSRSGDRYGYPVYTGIKHYGRSIVAINANGQSVPAGHADEVCLMGLAEDHADNTNGATGDKTVQCLRGVRRYPVVGADQSDIGSPVYALDDNTLQLTNAGGELQLGVLEAIDADGTWIRI